jgi:putative addiction module CopG family antidote
MTIHLPEELARFIHDVVRSGRYAREDDVIRDAVSRLRQALQEGDEATPGGPDPSRQGKALTKQEFQRHLMEIGLINQVPDSGGQPGEPSDASNESEDEILSERTIRERLIEWLAGFIGK